MIKIAAVIGSPDLQKQTLAVYSNDLRQAFQKVSRLGYQGVELMTKDPARLDGKSMKRWLEEAGVALVGLCTGHVYGEDGLGLVGPDRAVCEKAMKRLKEFVDFAAGNFGAGTMVNIGRSRGQGFRDDSERTLNEMAKSFGELADYAQPHGIRLVLEPITVNQTNFINTTQDGIEMVDRVGRENFGLMLDVYHMNIEDDDIYESIRQAGARCWFCHFTDNNRKYPGSAHLDFKRIVESLEEIGYDGYVSMEILPWPDPDTAARSAISHVRQFISNS